MKPLTVAAVFLLLGNAALLAQQTSNIAGLVRDTSGGAVATATVTLTETSNRRVGQRPQLERIAVDEPAAAAVRSARSAQVARY